VNVLVMTSEWPTAEQPLSGRFVAAQVEDLRGAGVSVDVLPFRGSSNPIRYARAFAALRSKLKENPYDVVHAHFGQVGFLAALQRRVPVVTTFHGSDLFGLAERTFVARVRGAIIQFLSKIAARRSAEIVVVSEKLAALLPRRRYHSVPMAIDLGVFRPLPRDAARKKLGWPEDETTALFVGDVGNPIKRFALAREACRIAGVRLRVCWNESAEGVALQMNAADLVLITSAHEGGPLVAWEALACGVPVVTVDVGAVRQRVGAVEGCVVTDSDDARTIAAGIAGVAATPGRRVDATAVLADLDRAAVAARLMEVYSAAVR
jgi:teichuronic acid biosynthesis glycosyltransferase TuaC